MTNFFKRLALLVASAAIGIVCGWALVEGVNAMFGSNEALLGLPFVAGFAVCFAGIACYGLVDLGPFAVRHRPRQTDGKAGAQPGTRRVSRSGRPSGLSRWILKAVGAWRWSDPQQISRPDDDWPRPRPPIDEIRINPGSGLPMVHGTEVDVAGNSYGTGGAEWSNGSGLWSSNHWD